MVNANTLPTLASPTECWAEELLPLKELAACYIRYKGDKGIPLNTLYRYAKTGVRGIRLRTIRKGLTLSSVRWLDEFFESTSRRD